VGETYEYLFQLENKAKPLIYFGGIPSAVWEIRSLVKIR